MICPACHNPLATMDTPTGEQRVFTLRGGERLHPECAAALPRVLARLNAGAVADDDEVGATSAPVADRDGD